MPQANYKQILRIKLKIKAAFLQAALVLIKFLIFLLTSATLFAIIIWRCKKPNICECAGIGRQARLRGVCPRRTGSSPVTRTSREPRHAIRVLRFFFFIVSTSRLRLVMNIRTNFLLSKENGIFCFLVFGIINKTKKCKTNS